MTKAEIFKWVLQMIQSLGLPAILFAIIAFLLKDKYSSVEREASLKAEVNLLKESRSEFKNEIAELKKDNLQLKEQASDKSHKENLLANYSFDNRLGIYLSKKETKPYCPKCLNEKHLESPLATSPHNWHCAVCNNYYSNPDYRRREVSRPENPFY